MGGSLKYSVEYRSTRSEIWRWYWRAWSRINGLWRYHAFLAAATTTAVVALRWQSGISILEVVLNAVMATAACLVLFPLWPQIRFKPQMRHLTIDQDGWKTRVGEISGSRTWDEVQAINDADDVIEIIGRNKNALLVPARAFSSQVEREEFVTAARAWQRKATATE